MSSNELNHEDGLQGISPTQKLANNTLSCELYTLATELLNYLAPNFYLE